MNNTNQPAPYPHKRGENPFITPIDDAAFFPDPTPDKIRPMMAPASNDPGYYDPASGEFKLDPKQVPRRSDFNLPLTGQCYAC